jgi:hypothetical protein
MGANVALRLACGGASTNQILDCPVHPIEKGIPMATNPPKGPGRKGPVRGRDQVFNPHNERWVKRDEDKKFMDQKGDKKSFKGVRKVKP